MAPRPPPPVVGGPGFILYTWQSISLHVLLLNGLDFTSLSFIDLPALYTVFILSPDSFKNFWHSLASSPFGIASTNRTVSYPPFAYHVHFFCIFSCSLLRLSQNFPPYIGHSPFWSFSMIFSNLLSALLYTLTKK